MEDTTIVPPVGNIDLETAVVIPCSCRRLRLLPAPLAFGYRLTALRKYPASEVKQGSAPSGKG